MKSYYRPDFDAHQAVYHRAQRRRRLLTMARSGALALVLGGTVALGAAAWASLGPGWVRARLSSLRLFRIERVEVSGNTTLTSAGVLAAAGVRQGESLLGVDLEAARANLVGQARVREASLRRRLPGTLIIDIAERVPCVVVRADRDYLVDAEGAIVGEAVPGSRPDLPVLTGVDAAAGALTSRGAADLADGIKLVAALRQVGFPALSAIDHVDLSDPNDAIVVPVAGRPLVHMGRRDPLTRLRRWHLVAPAMAQRWPEFEYVDLRAEGQVVALPAVPAPAEGTPDKPGERAPAQRPQRQGAGSEPSRDKAGGGNA